MNDNKENLGGTAFEDIWSSILSQKKAVEAGSGDPAPYVHPLVKRASSLSKKSLEICTESLGSETGSDGFSYPASDHEEEKEEEEGEKNKKDEFVKVAKYSYYPINKKCEIGVQKRSFPPPLPSLAQRDDGLNLQMLSRRQDGRLVLEAISVHSRNCFRASREGGRLLLTLANDDDYHEEQEDEDDEEMSVGDAEGNNVEKIELHFGIVNATTRPSPTVTMSKLMELARTRTKSSWPRSSNKTIIIKCVEENDEKGEKEHQAEVESTRQKIVSHSLPPRPRASTTTHAAAELNKYEYYWRRTDSPVAGAVAMLTPLAGKQNNLSGTVSPQVVKGSSKKMNKFVLKHNHKRGAQEEVVIVGGVGAGEKGEYLVPIVRGCKETRRSLFFSEHYCIATS